MGRTAAATKEPPKFLRVADVAAMLDISESHAYLYRLDSHNDGSKLRP